jgi:hypothetical protein
MQHIELSVELKLPGTDVLAAANEILESVEKGIPPYDAVSLSVDVRDLKIPFEGQLRVPVHARVERHEKRWESHIEIGAAAKEGFFPHFKGTLTVTPEGHGQSRIWLQGEYTPPLGILGGAINATVLHGVAEHSLNDFLNWLAKEIEKHVHELERSRQRQARHQ